MRAEGKEGMGANCHKWKDALRLRAWKIQRASRLCASIMAQQRTALWEADLDEDFHDVDLNLAIGNYGQNGLYNDGAQDPKCLPFTSLIALQSSPG